MFVEKCFNELKEFESQRRLLLLTHRENLFIGILVLISKPVFYKKIVYFIDFRDGQRQCPLGNRFVFRFLLNSCLVKRMGEISC